MADLRRHLGALGCHEVRTVVQSGNAVFRSRCRSPRALATAIAQAIQEAHGFSPAVFVMDAGKFVARLEANPFPEATAEPKTLHLFFAADRPAKPDREAIERACSTTERWELVGSALYLHAPDGIARSKLAAGVERWLGVPVTARNWNTLEKLRGLTAG
jgi:uncharacterized protein (DUF1697 family)